MPVIMGIFSAVVAIAKAVPVLDTWLQMFVSWYVTTQISSMKAENKAAIKTALEKQDQRDLEKALGNPNAGEPTNYPGTSIRDNLPGVH